MVDTKKIKALMGANDHTRKFMANYLKLSSTGLRNKLSGKTEFKLNELKLIADLYNVSIDAFIM